MKQTSSGQQNIVEPETNDLNPHLQQALSCLDIKLEDELARFRQQQSQQSVQISEETWLQHSADRDSDSSILSAEILPRKVSHPTLEQGDYEILPPSEGFGVLPERSAWSNTNPDRSPDNYGSVVTHAEDVSVPPEELDLKFEPAGAIAPFHNEYLASSQELLRQIQAEATTPPPPQPVAPPPKRKFFTPVRVGAIAAVCLAAAGAVYTYFNPSILAPLTGAKVATLAPTTGHHLGRSIQSPNLAANEFTEINLSNLNSIKVNSPTSTANVVQATTTTTATNTVAVPYAPVNPQTIVPTAIVQPKIADSLVKSLLPANFQQLAQQYQRVRTGQPAGQKTQR